jgi:hypothetical protein
MREGRDDVMSAWQKTGEVILPGCCVLFMDGQYSRCESAVILLRNTQ